MDDHFSKSPTPTNLASECVCCTKITQKKEKRRESPRAVECSKLAVNEEVHAPFRKRLLMNGPLNAFSEEKFWGTHNLEPSSFSFSFSFFLDGALLAEFDHLRISRYWILCVWQNGC
ncbi:hypothetical protein CDAR_215841 [Caerostris darwini]|uniref:Uncharacterized protein n=1 Tax=Caerostris darwini TaxID=1538125 RepID=A0AAV4NP93_9ARAC|nr:hypothetical protein CDAR_215841 [Caerostris darwini]